MGQEGYMEVAKKLMDLADIMKRGISEIEVCSAIVSFLPSFLFPCLYFRACVCVVVLT